MTGEREEIIIIMIIIIIIIVIIIIVITVIIIIIMAKLCSYEKLKKNICESCFWTNTLLVINHLLMNKTIV